MHNKNALKTGIDAVEQVVRGEDPESLAALTTEYYDHYAPATPQERCEVDTLVRAEWQMRRLARVDAQLWEWMLEGPGHLSEDAPLGQGFSRGSNHFIRLQRRIDAADRSYRNTLRELERLQSERLAVAPVDPPSAESAVPAAPPPAARPPVEIGFVPQPQSPRAKADPPAPPSQSAEMIARNDLASDGVSRVPFGAEAS